MKVRIGQTVTGGKVHLSIGVATCPVAARKPLINSIPAHKVDVAELCHWCRRQDNLEAAHVQNVFGQSGYSMALETLLLNVEVVRTVRQEWERAIEAANSRQQMEGDASRASSGAIFAPVVVTQVQPKTAFVEAVERMGVRANRAPVRAKVKSPQSRLARLNMFVTAKPKAA